METKKTNQWILFVGVVLILLGIYGSVRSLINILAFEKYPVEGVYPDNLPFFRDDEYYYSGFTREEDCDLYPMTYYIEGTDKTRPATPEEKIMEKRQVESCVSLAKETRDKAKIDDISQSLLFLFLGVGVFAFRRVFDK